MTLLNSSCPLNIAETALRTVRQHFYKHETTISSHRKDTDSLDCFQGGVKRDRAHSSAFPILVLQDVSSNHQASHAKHLLQLLPAHFVIELPSKRKVVVNYLHRSVPLNKSRFEINTCND